MLPTAHSLGIGAKKSSLALVPSGAAGKSLSKSNLTNIPSSHPLIVSNANTSMISQVIAPASFCALISDKPPE